MENEFVQAVIEDHGVGFNEKLNQSNSSKSSHFGLKIMRERAGEVGGTVQVESAPAKGTRVIARLPRKLSSGEALAARVMIADDHPLFMDGLRNMLAVRGVHVIGTARDGMEHGRWRALCSPILS
ncbi:ATP-binding protein [Candidatus Villigracilis affinis]|uniref:ATP-binding protein n=1 Tax=Candidatus Villigracilis affinis TaxID=3140682 RepID=UPI0031ED7560